MYIRTLKGLETRIAAIRRSLEDRVPVLLTDWDEDDLAARAAGLKYGVCDFDGTLHVDNQWRAMDRHLPPEMVAKDNTVYAAYRAFRLAPKDGADIHACGPQSTAHLAAWETQWIERGMRTYRDGGLTEADLMDAGISLVPRDGAGDLLDLFFHRAVISMGIEPVIRAFLDAHGFSTPKRPVWVGASRVEFDPEGRILGCALNAFPAALKREVRDWFLRNVARWDGNPDAVFALGDSAGDLELMERGRGLNAFVMPFPARDAHTEGYRDEHLADIVEIADVVSVGDSLQPLADFIRASKTAAS